MTQPITAAFYCKKFDMTTFSRSSDAAYTMKTWFKHGQCVETDHEDTTKRWVKGQKLSTASF